MSKDVLVSTTVLREALDEVRAKQREDAEYLPEYVVKRADWVIARMEKALRDAEREYVGMADAVRLTGWDAKTLAKYGRAALDGEKLPEEWSGLLARFDGRVWSFCLSSVPYKPRKQVA